MDKAKRVVGILLIVVGLAVICSVGYKKFITAQKNKALIENFNNSLNGDSESKDVSNGESINLDEINAIAIMEIPSIKLVQGVVEGISDNVLQYYLGHFPESVAPGESGNFAVAGHRVSDYTDAFINLYKVKIGDEIVIKTREKKFTYAVEESFIVEPEEVYVLDQTDDATITLVTCTVGAKQRVIVKGKLINSEEL